VVRALAAARSLKQRIAALDTQYPRL